MFNITRFIFNYIINNKENRFSKLSNHNNKGFTLLEIIIAVAIGAIILGGGIALAVSTVKSGKFVEKLTDTAVVLSQKTTQLFNNAANEIGKIPKGQTKVGSVNPEQPITGYFELLNESGCTINSSKGVSFPIPADPGTGKGITKTSNIGDVSNASATTGKTGTGKLGDIGNGDSDGDGGALTPLDCSVSGVPTPSNSLLPKFRRQWMIIKDFPTPGDISFSVVVVAIQTNEIIMSSAITKSDGISVK